MAHGPLVHQNLSNKTILNSYGFIRVRRKVIGGTLRRSRTNELTNEHEGLDGSGKRVGGGGSGIL